MGGADDTPRAVVRLVHGDHEVVLGPIDPRIRCDLRLVDDLLRLRLLTGRLGWTIRITDVRPDLQELVELIGLTDQLDGGQASR